jgi:hypothetical protein
MHCQRAPVRALLVHRPKPADLVEADKADAETDLITVARDVSNIRPNSALMFTFTLLMGLSYDRRLP